MGKYKKWNMNELQFIADNEKLLKDSDIAAKLTKSQEKMLLEIW